MAIEEYMQIFTSYSETLGRYAKLLESKPDLGDDIFTYSSLTHTSILPNN